MLPCSCAHRMHNMFVLVWCDVHVHVRTDVITVPCAIVDPMQHEHTHEAHTHLASSISMSSALALVPDLYTHTHTHTHTHRHTHHTHAAHVPDPQGERVA